MIVQEDSVTSYKPVIYPNLFKFNEEVESEIGLNKTKQLIEAHSSNTDNILGEIIMKLDKSSLLQDKLSQLRKIQKKREKKHILSERIESETSGTEVIAAAQLQ